MRIRYMVPLYDFHEEITHIAVPQSAQVTLSDMGNQLSGTNDLVAVYIPEGTDEAYQPGNKRGRVVGAVRLLSMSSDKTIWDYFYEDWDRVRWPCGWPCEAVFAPAIEECRYLRGMVEDIYGQRSFFPFVSRLHSGPITIDPKMSDIILASLQ